MSSNAQPTPQQLKPLVESNSSLWTSFTKAMTIGVISIVILLSLMAVFLVKH